MTEKQQQALDTVFSTLPEECRESYREIAGYVTHWAASRY